MHLGLHPRTASPKQNPNPTRTPLTEPGTSSCLPTRSHCPFAIFTSETRDLRPVSQKKGSSLAEKVPPLPCIFLEFFSDPVSPPVSFLAFFFSFFWTKFSREEPPFTGFPFSLPTQSSTHCRLTLPRDFLFQSPLLWILERLQ